MQWLLCIFVCGLMSVAICMLIVMEIVARRQNVSMGKYLAARAAREKRRKRHA